jgi:hypothetical protein
MGIPSLNLAHGDDAVRFDYIVLGLLIVGMLSAEAMVLFRQKSFATLAVA